MARPKSRLLTRHNQENAQWSPDPFPRMRLGSGHKTKALVTKPFSLWVGSGCEATAISSINIGDSIPKVGYV